MSNSRTIHFVYPYPLKSSGSGILIQELAKRLTREGYKTHLITIENEPFLPYCPNCTWDGLIIGESFPSKEVPVYTGIGSPYIRFSDMSQYQIQLYLETLENFWRQTLLKQISKNDIVIVSHLWFHSLILKKLGIPVHGIISHGTDLMALSNSPEFMNDIRESAEWAERIVTTSNFVLNEIALLGFKNKNNISCIYPGVDTSLFKYRSVHRSQQKLILHVPGKNAYFKGTDRLLRAIKCKKSEFKDIQFVIISYGHLNKELSDLKMSIKNEIQWKNNWISRRQLVELLQSASLLIVPSRKEPFGMIAAEALACGTAVIGDKSGGLLEIIGPGDGLLVSTSDPNALATAIIQTISNQDSNENKINRSRHSHERFGWSIIIQKWVKWLEEASVSKK